MYDRLHRKVLGCKRRSVVRIRAPLYACEDAHLDPINSKQMPERAALS